MRALSLRGAYGLLLILISLQLLTHFGWLSISAHSGQTAIPWMMTQGRVLFGSLLEQHAPATSVIAAITQTVLRIDPLLADKLLNTLLVTANTLLIFAIARRVAGDNNTAGLAASLVWFWWEPVYGNVLFYFDSLLSFCLCCAIACLLYLKGSRALFLAGLFIGLATLAKQHAWLAAVVFFTYVLFVHRRGVLIYVVGLAVLPVLAVLIVIVQGNFQNYWYWNWQFNFSGLMDSEMPQGDFVRKLLLSNVFVPAFLLLVLRSGSGLGAGFGSDLPSSDLPKQRRLGFWLGALWAAAFLTLVPRFGIVHAMAHLPLSAICSGVVIAALVGKMQIGLQRLRTLSITETVLTGVLICVGAAWLWTGGVVYVPGVMGIGSTPAYDEFHEISARLQHLASEGATLFVLPETDSTPQIHALSGLLAPGTWVKGWAWYLEVPNMLQTLLDEWSETPPDLVVVFPALLQVGEPAIQPLVEFVNTHYVEVERISNIVFHGDAVIYAFSTSALSR